jgi:hypothetical protein
VSEARCQYGSVILVKISQALSLPRSLWSVPELTELEARTGRSRRTGIGWRMVGAGEWLALENASR